MDAATSEHGMTDQEARRLEAALEAVRLMLLGDDPFHRLLNANRSNQDQPADWTKGFSALFSTPAMKSQIEHEPEPGTRPDPTPKTYGFKEEKDRIEAGPTFPVQSPILRPNDPLPPDQRETATVPAFDKPISVIIVGPNPLPVRLIDEPIVPGKEANNTPRNRNLPAAERQGGGFGAIAQVLGRQFAFVMGPLMAFGTILSQSNSGFGVFGKAVNLLGATLAPLLLPAFVLLATGLLSLSDMIWSKLLPALGDFYKWMMDKGIPAVAEQVGKAGDAIDTGTALKNFFTKGELPKKEDLPRMLDSYGRNTFPGFEAIKERLPETVLGGYAGFAKHLGFEIPQIPKIEDLTQAAGQSAGISGPGVSEPKVDATKNVRENLNIVMRSLQQSIGPKAAYTGLTDVTKNATLAALNQDPIEAKQLKVMQDTFVELQKVVGKMDEPDRRDDQFRRGRPGAQGGGR